MGQDHRHRPLQTGASQHGRDNTLRGVRFAYRWNCEGNARYGRDIGRMTNLAKAAGVATLFASILFSGVFGSDAHAQTGMASYYKSSGSRTANGERFDPQGLTAAHRSLPFGTRVRVMIVDTGRSVVVRINDRGPFVSSRVIDLTFGAARVIGLHTSGVAKVSMEVLR